MIAEQKLLTYSVLDHDFTVDGARVQRLSVAAKNASDIYTATARWDLEKLLKRQVTASQPATFSEMLPLWFGPFALLPVSKNKFNAYCDFARKKGVMDRLQSVFGHCKVDVENFIEADLSRMVDYVMLESAFPPSFSSERLCILEVGGGCGALAEIFLKCTNLEMCYVLVDGISESLCYQWDYLRSKLPEAKIGATFNGDKFDPAEFDIFIMPSWDMAITLKDRPIHVAINIASIQEMPEETANAYLAYFDESLVDNGIVFFQNSREYYYQREYHFPVNWRYLSKDDTPRSRSLDYPMDMMQKLKTDQRVHNYNIMMQYYVSLKKKALNVVVE